jgi:hypothetical protein
MIILLISRESKLGTLWLDCVAWEMQGFTVAYRKREAVKFGAVNPDDLSSDDEDDPSPPHHHH